MYKAVSVSELQKEILDFILDLSEESRQDLSQLLFDRGIDTAKKVEFHQNTQHRNKYGQVVDCPRFLGVERTDWHWLRSGKASIEAMYHDADFGTKAEMRKICIGTSFEKQDIEELGLYLDNLPDEKK